MRRVAGIVLAAGASRRMGPETNKLLEEVGGAALVCWAVDALLACSAAPVIVVTGYDEAGVRRALGARNVRVVQHAAWAEGMGGSIARGIQEIGAIASDCEGVLVCMGDLPALRGEHVRPLLQAFAAAARDAICIPTHAGRRGHPVLFAEAYFAELGALSGEAGARSLLERHREALIEVEIGSEAILHDVDTPDALAEARQANEDSETGSA
jgi:molybdenum cofactor cytidylyltransferase